MTEAVEQDVPLVEIEEEGEIVPLDDTEVDTQGEELGLPLEL